MKRWSFVVASLVGAGCQKSAPVPAAPQVSAERVRVRTAKLEVKTVSGVRTFPGILQPWQRATLGARAAGYLATMRVDRGSHVKKGDLLATVAIPGLSESLAGAEGQLHTAEADLAVARDQEKRANRVANANPEAIASAEVASLSGKASAADARLQAARADVARARALGEDAVLRAPFDGVVVARYADQGAVLTVGAKVVDLVALDPLRLAIDVPERDAARLRVGQSATVVLPAAGDRKLTAKVARFAEVLDPATHTLRAEIDVPNPGTPIDTGIPARLRSPIVSGIEARATIDFGEHAALLLPAEAIVSEGAGASVLVVQEGRARKRPVRIAYDDGKDVEIQPIASGDRAGDLAAGAEVIVGGRGLISEGDAVEVAR
jgi:RND family efflux transporter MFP subunit